MPIQSDAKTFVTHFEMSVFLKKHGRKHDLFSIQILKLGKENSIKPLKMFNSPLRKMRPNYIWQKYMNL